MSQDTSSLPPDAVPLPVKKSQLRKAMKTLRARVPRELRVKAALAAAEHGAALVAALPRHQVVALYTPTGDEFDARPLAHALDRAGHALALPRVKSKNTPLVFHQWAPEDPLVAGAYGILEPEAAAPTVVPAVVFCPLLAFDEQGQRLGYGGGYYDRTLAALSGVKAIGLGYSFQLVNDLPVDSTDMPMHAVVTEVGAMMPLNPRQES